MPQTELLQHIARLLIFARTIRARVDSSNLRNSKKLHHRQILALKQCLCCSSWWLLWLLMHASAALSAARDLGSFNILEEPAYNY